jgi:hypothetical protein
VSTRVLTGIIWLLIATTSALASEVSIVRIQPGWRDAASFKRVSEYFSGRENTGGQIVIRTQPDERAGFYFLARVKNSGAPLVAKIRLELIGSKQSDPVVHTLTTELKSGDSVLNVGITGADWPDPRVHPIAWKFELLGEDARLLARETSYLWAKPATR